MRAERRYRAVDAENRLVARGLEAEWEQRLRDLDDARAELARRDRRRPALEPEQRRSLLCLGEDIRQVWFAPSTAHRDQKELLRTLVEDVTIAVYRDEHRARLVLRWRGGALTEVDVDLPRSRPATVRTDEDTLDLLRRLATYYSDSIIAGILNRQQRTTARGLRFTANAVGNLRRHWRIPGFEPSAPPAKGDLVNVRQAAAALGVAPSTVHRWLNDGFLAGEQLTPAAPWQIRISDDLRARIIDTPGPGYVTMREAVHRLGITRQAVWQRVKRGELHAVHARRGPEKGTWIKLLCQEPTLFQHAS